MRPEHVSRWTAGLLQRAGRLFERLAETRNGLREADRPVVDQILDRRSALPGMLNPLLPSDIGGSRSRRHGDFRLGHILIVKDDIFISDFDGDPRLPLAERLRKAPAACDVAGFVRSIEHSVIAALNRAPKGAPEEQARIATALGEWRERTIANFLAAYREAMTDRRLWPADPHAADGLLNFFLLDQAFDEVEYELPRRPEGLHAPLTGLLRILSNAETEAHA